MEARRPTERAEVVWRHALELAQLDEKSDPYVDALELVRAGGSDPTAMAHAVTLGLTRLRRGARPDAEARRAVALLEGAVALLGNKGND